METESKPSIKVKVVKTTDRALKLAERWVSNMSGLAAAEPDDLEIVGRPLRVGLGAKVLPHIKPAPSNDPIERKLRQKVDANKRRRASAAEEAETSEDDDSEPESRTKAFSKKRTMPPATSSQSIKKKK